MIFLIQLLAFLQVLFRPAITSVKTSPDPVAGLEQAGALVPNGAMVQALAALQNNAAPAFGNWNQVIIPQSLAAATYNAQNMVGGIIRRFNTAAGNVTDSTDTATNIVNAIPGAKVNQTFPMLIANMGSAGLTVAAGTGVTLQGTNVVGGFSMRLFLGQITGSAAVTLTPCFSFGLQSGL